MGNRSAIVGEREYARQALKVDPLSSISDSESKRLLRRRKRILDSAELDAELKARFNLPGVESFSELRTSGIDYSAAVPLLKSELDRIENPDVKIRIASLLAFPQYDAAANIARAIRDVAARKPDAGLAESLNYGLQGLSQYLIDATADKDRGSFYQLASDPSLPKTSRFFFLEAMTKSKDQRAIPLLEELLESERATGAPIFLLRLLEKFNPEGFQGLVDSFQDHEDKEVRDVVAKIRIRVARKALKQSAKSRPKLA